jgi:hypothetical protein
MSSRTARPVAWFWETCRGCRWPTGSRPLHPGSTRHPRHPPRPFPTFTPRSEPPRRVRRLRRLRLRPVVGPGVDRSGSVVLGWGQVVAGGVQPAVVVPVDPFQDGEFDVVEALPGPRGRITSVSNSPISVSARALLNASPLGTWASTLRRTRPGSQSNMRRRPPPLAPPSILMIGSQPKSAAEVWSDEFNLTLLPSATTGVSAATGEQNP